MCKSELGLGPFASVTEYIRVKMEVASKPAEEIEKEGTEGVACTRSPAPWPTARSRCSVTRRCTSSATVLRSVGAEPVR